MIPEGFLYFGKGPLKVLPIEDQYKDVAGRMLPDGGWDTPPYAGTYRDYEYAIRSGTKLAKDNGLEPKIKAAKLIIKKCTNTRCPPDYIAFQIVEQENIPADKLFKASNGMEIVSRCDASFGHEDNIFFLRGDCKSGDNNIIVVSRKQYEDIILAVEEYLAYLNKPKILYRATFNTVWGRKCWDVYSDEGKMIRGYDVDNKTEGWIPTGSIIGPIEKICLSNC